MMKIEQHQAGAAQWLYARFERDTRYYELRLQQDLFGWVVIKVWGRCDSRKGQRKVAPCACGYEQAEAIWDKSIRIRRLMI